MRSLLIGLSWTAWARLSGLVSGAALMIGALALGPQAAARAQTEALGIWPVTLTSGGAPASWTFSNALGIDPFTNAAEPGRPGLALQDAVLDISPTLFALDTSLVVAVDGQQFVAPAEVTATAQTLTTGEVDLAGLRVALRYTALADRPAVRTLISLRNPQTAPVTVTVALASNVSAGGNAISTLATGGANLTPADAWLVTGDSGVVPAPDVVQVFFGPGPSTRPAAVSQTVYDDLGTEGAVVTYTVAVAPAATRRLMFFTEVREAGAGVAAAADYTPTLQPASLFAGLTADERREIINWLGHQVFLPAVLR